MFRRSATADREGIPGRYGDAHQCRTRYVHKLGAICIVDTEGQAAFFGKWQWLDERPVPAKQALSPRFLPPSTVSDIPLSGSLMVMRSSTPTIRCGRHFGRCRLRRHRGRRSFRNRSGLHRFQNAAAAKQRGVILASEKNDEANVPGFSNTPTWFSGKRILQNRGDFRRQGERHPRDPAGVQYFAGPDGLQ
jgi:hypothetical protein